MRVRGVLEDNRPSWHNPRVLLFILLIFLTGFSAGAFVTRLVTGLPASRAAAPSWREGGREVTIDVLKRELQLSPEQSAEVETVLDDFVMYYQNLQGQMDDWRVEAKKRIQRILSPEQRKKFDKFMGQMQKSGQIK